MNSYTRGLLVGLTTGFLLGAAVGTVVLAKAQFFDSYDNQGHELSGYTDQSGNTMWQDSQGHSGTIYQEQAQPILPLFPCR